MHISNLISTVSTPSTITNQLHEIALDASPWALYYNFTAKPISMNVLTQDPFLYWLSERYAYKAGILKMEPYHQYDWHIDDRRGVGINMLLSFNGTSVCMFSPEPKKLVKNIYPIIYTPNTYTVFNTQLPHCVINFNEPRYLFSIEFDMGKDELTYVNLCDAIIAYEYREAM